MLRDLRLFFKYARSYGFRNTLVFSLFKFFPKYFVLLFRKTKMGNDPVCPEMAEVDHISTSASLFDYVPWTEFGGAPEPIPSKDPRRSFIWFVPDWRNVWGGGHYTLFRFANHFAKSDTRNIIYVYNNSRHSSPEFLQNQLDNALKNCKLEVIINPKLLPSCSAAIATTWQSAFHVKAYEFTHNKFYFMQDYESYFYSFGTASMQANATYSFGFAGVTGGGWLKQCYESHGGKAQNYLFCADKEIFFPAMPDGRVRSKVKRIFFYGRPSTERRCFELGLVTLKQIAESFSDVEIAIAGLDLKSKLPFKAMLLGNLSLQETGELYRTCDIGIAFSATNLSYLPVELMASGVPVISNRGPQVEWHCRHLQNAYLVDPTPKAVFEGVSTLYHDAKLRQRLADGGLKTMEPLIWEKEMTNIYEYICHSIK
ncbi:MAG: rhamnosyltransferase WsaF family glycosyltransferase [Leptospirales bacterium]